MDGGGMYRELAALWPLVCRREDYEEEMRHWSAAIADAVGPGPWRVLDLGTGGGFHLSYLDAAPGSVAVDLSPEMLEHSRRLNPAVEHLVGDMRDVRLDRRFDVVVSHDAISYMTTRADLARVCEVARAHLRPGGVALFMPDFTTETFRDGEASTRRTLVREREFTYFEYFFDEDRTDTIIEALYVYVVRAWAGPPRVYEDRHRLGLFPRSTWRTVMEGAGFFVDAIPLSAPGLNRDVFIFRGVSSPSE